jgi:outer membrane receptor protein involved in Fe transport
MDKFGNIAKPVFSPRAALLWKPGPDHSLRVSVNRAFRSPSALNDFLYAQVLTPVDLASYFPDLPPPLAPLVEDDFLLTQSVLGNAALKQESLTSYELGYIGTLSGRTTLGFNLYVNDTSDNINFFSPPADEDPYTAADPPPNWPLPPASLTALAAQGVYFSQVRNQFMNLGPIRHRGIELFAEHRFQDGITGFVNYSWQPDPKPLAAAVPFPAAEISIPPRSRVNAGVYWAGRRFTGSLAMNYVERAFWVDVLPHAYDGWSPGYTTFSGSLGIRFAGGKVQATLRGTNLANADVQPNAFGDIFKRMVTAELRFAF